MLGPVEGQKPPWIAAAHNRRRFDKPFRYVDFGNLATVGRKAAIADFRGFHLKGFVGWLLWSVAHVYFLIGFRNRIAVTLDWLWSYLTFERGARLITGDVAEVRPTATPKREAA